MTLITLLAALILMLIQTPPEVFDAYLVLYNNLRCIPPSPTELRFAELMRQDALRRLA